VAVRAKLYVASVIAAGAAIVALSLIRWECANVSQYATYLILAILASMCKVRVPGITGTYSLNFLFILLSIVALSLGETVTLGCVCALVQTLWKPAVRAPAVHMAFNAGNMAISTAVSYSVAAFAMRSGFGEALPIVLTLAASVYFVVNTLLVSGVLTLVDHKPLFTVWSKWFFWSFPYYLLGAAMAGMISVSTRQVGWHYALLGLPATFLLYSCYRLYIESGTNDTKL
jgi:hypothetical protein